MSRVSGVGTPRVCLGAIGLFMLPAGVLAALALGAMVTSPRRPVT